MADKENILSSSLVPKEHLAIFDQIVMERFDAIDLTPMLMYLIDVVPAVALPALAEQFDVLGFNGWFLTSTTEDRRTLIKRAIELKRFRGTPWAVREALKSVGYYDVMVVEGVGGFRYDGLYKHDGEINYGAGYWANFSLKFLDLGETKGFSTADLTSIINMVNRYKNERSNLLDILLSATVADIEEMTDEFAMLGDLLMSDSLNTSFRYDGLYKHDGSKQYGVNTEVFVVSKNLITEEDTFSAPDDSEFEIILIPSGFTFIVDENGNNILSGSDSTIIGNNPEEEI